jgi:hypothetical protein
MSELEAIWRARAQEDPWRIAITTQIQADKLEDLIATASLKPVPILASAFDAAKVFHKSPKGSARNAPKSKFDVHNGGFLLTNKNPRFGVTLGSVDRALSIVNFILHQCERYGIKTELDSSQYVIVSHGRGSSRLSINERIEEIFVSPDTISTRTKPVAGSRVKRGTGQLSITIYGVWTRRFVDHGDDTLEGQISKIITKIVQALAEKNACLDDLDWRMVQQRVADQAQAAEVERSKNLAEQLEAMRAAHLARDQELLAEAAAWEQAASIRRYVEHIAEQSKQSTAPRDQNLSSWISWALAFADQTDPTMNRITGNGKASEAS